MSRWNLAWLLGVPAVVVLGLTLTYSAPLQPRDHNYTLVRMVVDVLSEVEENFVRPLSAEEKEKLVKDMINGGLVRLDPYSHYFDPDDYRRFETESEGNFGGIGVQVGLDRATNMLKVISPMVGTPAYEAGLMAGDLIVKVNDKPTDEMTMNEAIRLILGEPGTQVRLTVLHEGDKEPEEVTVTRALIEIEAVLGYRRDPANPAEWDWFADAANRIGYVRLVSFNEHTARDLAAALARLEAAGARGLVLDLRDNPGGLLSAAVEVADLFLTAGPIVSTRDRNGRGRTWDASEAGTMFLPASSHPVAVLINENSASASEIVAAALQDHKRAVVVGERSFGKGSVQKVFKLSHSDPPSALKLTTDTYWRPSGHNIHRHPEDKESDEWGVKPDEGFAVELKPEERLRFLIDQRQRERVPGKGNGKPGAKIERPDPEEKKDDEPFVDRVLEKALEYLRAEAKKLGAAPFVEIPAVRRG